MRRHRDERGRRHRRLRLDGGNNAPQSARRTARFARYPQIFAQNSDKYNVASAFFDAKEMLFSVARRHYEAASRVSYVLSYWTATRPSYTRELPCKGQNQVLEADADTACFITFGD